MFEIVRKFLSAYFWEEKFCLGNVFLAYFLLLAEKMLLYFFLLPRFAVTNIQEAAGYLLKKIIYARHYKISILVTLKGLQNRVYT